MHLQNASLRTARIQYDIIFIFSFLLCPSESKPHRIALAAQRVRSPRVEADRHLPAPLWDEDGAAALAQAPVHRGVDGVRRAQDLGTFFEKKNLFAGWHFAFRAAHHCGIIASQREKNDEKELFNWTYNNFCGKMYKHSATTQRNCTKKAGANFPTWHTRKAPFLNLSPPSLPCTLPPPPPRTCRGRWRSQERWAGPRGTDRDTLRRPRRRPSRCRSGTPRCSRRIGRTGRERGKGRFLLFLQGNIFLWKRSFKNLLCLTICSICDDRYVRYLYSQFVAYFDAYNIF